MNSKPHTHWIYKLGVGCVVVPLYAVATIEFYIEQVASPERRPLGLDPDLFVGLFNAWWIVCFTIACAFC